MGPEEVGSSSSLSVDYLETVDTIKGSVDCHEGINIGPLPLLIWADVPNTDSVNESLCNGWCLGSMPVFEGGSEWTCKATNKTAIEEDSTCIAVVVHVVGRW